MMITYHDHEGTTPDTARQDATDVLLGRYDNARATYYSTTNPEEASAAEQAMGVIFAELVTRGEDGQHVAPDSA